MATLGNTARFYLDRLRGVSTSTRMLAGALVVILLMGFFLVSLYASRTEMVPLPITLTGDARARTVSFLSSRGLAYEESGAAILVMRDDRDQIVTQLNEASVITPDQIDFDRLIKDERMFLTQGQQRTRTRVATQNVLGRMISQMTGIQSATVVISIEKGHVGIGRAFIPRTASVTVMTDVGPMSSSSVDAVARMVAGSISGLKAEDVSVIDARTGRAMVARSEEAMASTLNMEIKLAAEKMALARLEEALGYISGIRISVNAVVETRETVRETTSYEDPKTGRATQLPLESRSQASASARDPGMLVNAGLHFLESLTTAITPGPGPGPVNEQVENVSTLARSDQRVIDPGGYALEINASIGVPRSYFTALQRQREELEGSQAARGEVFDAFVLETLDSIEIQVIPLVATGSAQGSRQGEVTVSVFEDVVVPEAPLVAPAPSWTAATGSRGWLSTLSLILLAAIAICMMAMMVRRVGARAVRGPGGPSMESRQQLMSEIDEMGAVDDSTVVPDGIENDSDSPEDARWRHQETLEGDRGEGVLNHGVRDEVRTPFSFLREVECETLLAFIQEEHPQTIALIASYLDQDRASEIFVGLPADKQVDVVRRVANMEQPNLDLVWEVEAGLQDRLANILSSSSGRVGGVKAVAEVLNLCDRNTERNIMNGMKTDSPELVENIRRLMFEFEDIRFVNDRGIQAVLKEIDNDQLAVSLKTASEDLHEKIFSNMSERAADVVREDMKYMGPVRLSDVEAAQQGILDIVRRLEDAGQLIISGRGGDPEVVV